MPPHQRKKLKVLHLLLTQENQRVILHARHLGMLFLVLGLFSGASIFDTIADDYDLHWDLASLDDDFNFNGDLDSHANKASKSKPMCCEPPLHSQSPYIMNETQSTNVNSHIEMASNESLVKDPLPAVACTEEIVDNNQAFHAFPTPPKVVEEMVPDTSSLQAPPSPPPLSTSGMGYSADYQPLSSYASSLKAQRLPSQQKVVDHATHGHVFASENTTQGSRCRRNQAQASHGWADGDNKQGSTSKKFLKKKYAVILKRDFLLVNRTFQSSLKPNKAFRFFHLLLA